jgi:hypothetical protein
MALTFLTPKLPPCVCGVGDHTVALAAALRHETSPVTAIHIQDCGNDEFGMFDKIDRWNRHPASFKKILQKHGTDILWVQYSGYGFGYQGMPWYLVRALDSLDPELRIVVFFHEIHCSKRQLGWKGFIVSPMQKHIAKALAKRADVVLASSDLYATIIQSEYGVPPDKFGQLSLGSNVSIPHFDEEQRNQWRSDLGWRPNERVAVAFGSSGSQRRALVRNQAALAAAISANIIQRVVCVGGAPRSGPVEPLMGIDPSVAQVTTVMGYQLEENVARILVAADLALMAYPFERYGKSGVFMAYSLAGLPVAADPGTDAVRTTYRAARLISFNYLMGDHSQFDDIDGRLSRHRQAQQSYSWPALASQAIALIQPHLSPASALMN